MSKTVKMVTEGHHEYAGRWLKVGDRFEAEQGHVALLIALGRARVDEQTYQTREMVGRSPFNGARKRRASKEA